MTIAVTVQECAYFAKKAYAGVYSPTNEIRNGLWQPICNHNILSGPDQVVVRGWTRDNDTIIAVKGTTPTNIGDIASDEQLALGLKPSEFAPAMAVSRLATLHAAENVIFTGHSLGGHLAQRLAEGSLSNTTRYVTFNAPGINTRANTRSGVNIYVKWDLVRLAGGRHYGATYKIDSKFQDFLSAHKMDNVIEKLEGDPIGAMSVDEAIRRALIFG